jgi:hypothetical protein
VRRHVATEHPITLEPEQVRRFLDLHGRAPATRLRLPVRCGTSLVDGHRAGPKRWSLLDFSRAWIDPGPSPAGNPGPYLKAGRTDNELVHRIYCRFYAGLRLWVRESFHAEHPADYYAGRFRAREGLAYAADYAAGGGFNELLWQPAAKMTRPMSRLDLAVGDLMVQRLLEASEEDARAEGFDTMTELVAAFREQHGARLPAGTDVSPWTWVLHVTARSP